MLRASEHIDELIGKLGYFKSEVSSIMHAYEDYQLQWKASSEEWSVTECLDHINHYNASYMPQLAEKITLGHCEDRNTNSPYRSSYYGNMMVGFVSPDSRYKLKSSPQTQPQLRNVKEIRDRNEAMISQFAQIIERARGCDLNNTFVVSPEDQMIKMPLGDKLKFLVEHQLRHLSQIKRILVHPNFPK